MDSSFPFYFSYAALWILVIFQSLILLGLVRMVAQLQQTRATASLSEGQEAPPFNAVSLSGASINSKDFVGRLTALLFISPNCQSCAETLNGDMDYLLYKSQGNVIVICRAGREDCARLAEPYKLNMPIVADEDDRISRLYAVSSVPMAVIINANNRIQSYGQPKRGEELEEMFEKAPEAELQAVG